MTITVQIPTALRRHTAGTAKLDCGAANLDELFSVLDQRFPELKPHLRDEAGQIRRFLNVYVNEEDIRFLGGAAYAFQDGDEVLLVPSIAGGCGSIAEEQPGGTGFCWPTTTRRSCAAPGSGDRQG
jgi:sulfur-carrier protein